MSPVFTIFGLEWRRAWSNRRALVVVACVAALTVTAAIDGARRAVKERQEQIQATAAMRDFWIGQGQANPHSAAHFGVHVFQPTPRLAFFEPGHLSALPSASHLEAHHQNLFRFRPSRDEAPGRLFSLTPAGLLQVLMPLWALFLAFDAVSGERARGTLAQLFLAGASARQLLVGKALGVLSVLGAAMAPAALVSIFVGVVWVGIDRGDVLVLGWICGLHAVVAAAWALAGVAVSAICRTSRTALVILLGVWVAQTVLLPRVAVAISEIAVPLPGLPSFEARVEKELQNGLDGHDPEDERVEKLKQETMRKYGVQRVEDLPINFDGLRMQASEEHGNEVFDARFGELFDAMEHREQVARWLGLLSPLELLRPSSMALAETDFAHHRRFVEAAERYRRALVKQMNLVMAERSKTGDWAFTVGEDVWRSVPAFEAPARRPRPLVDAQLGLLAWLAAAGVLLAAAAKRVSAT